MRLEYLLNRFRNLDRTEGTLPPLASTRMRARRCMAFFVMSLLPPASRALRDRSAATRACFSLNSRSASCT